MGKRITLESFRAVTFLSDDSGSEQSNIKLELYADSTHKVYEETFDIKRNVSRPFLSGAASVRGCLSSMELVLIEEDSAGGAGLDDDTDELFPPVDLLYPPTGSEIVKAELSNISADGTSWRTTMTLRHPERGGEFVLTYSVADQWEFADSAVATARVQHKPSTYPVEELHGDLKADKGDCKWICSIDGGGMRGIFALRALEQLEKYYRVSCNDMFDMYSCTSTGALIGVSLASGMPLADIIALYCSSTIRAMIWRKSNSGQENALYNVPLLVGPFLGYKASSGTLREWMDWYDYDVGDAAMPEQILRGALVGIAQRLLAPQYRKDGIVPILNSVFSRSKNGARSFLTLGELEKDVLVTAFDTHAQETVSFTAFHSFKKMGPLHDPPIAVGFANVYGKHKNLHVKDVVEASMSAPPFFAPRERFVDGGVGSYNNPVFLAAYAALHESHSDPGSPIGAATEPLYKPYVAGLTPSGTVIFSFGTGVVKRDRKVAPFAAVRPTFADAGSTLIAGEDGKYSVDLDRPIFATFWIENLIEAFMTSASEQQTDVVRKLMEDQVKLVRCNIEVSEALMDEWGAQDKRAIKFAPTEQEFPVMDNVAKQFAANLRTNRFGFDSGGVYVKVEVASDNPSTYAARVAEAFRKNS